MEVYRLTDFIPKRVVVSRLHDTVAIFRTGRSEILAPLLKMRPHDSQSSRENAPPSRGTSPLASYKEVPRAFLDQLKEVETRNIFKSSSTKISAISL